MKPRDDLESMKRTCRFGMWAGILTLAGVLLSGPVALALVAALGPQPEWESAAVFAEHYQSIQLLPYAFGLALVVGSAMTVGSFVLVMPARHRAEAWLASVMASVFAGLILLNYIIQTTFLRSLALHRRPELDPLIEGLAMANPRGLPWALEMWGYAFLGIAMWLVAPAFSGTRLERLTRGLFIANAVVSVVGGVMTTIQLDWVFSWPGIVSFAVWNVLMVVLAAATIAVWRAREVALVHERDEKRTAMPSIPIPLSS